MTRNDELRERAESTVGKKESCPPKDLVSSSPESSLATLHELRVHQIELEMQNEELRRAQADLEAERSRYFELYDLAPVGYVTLSEQGLIMEANLSTSTMLGLARGELVKQPISRFINKEDQDFYYLRRKRLLESGDPQSCELRMVKNDGTPLWAHLDATLASDEAGAPICRITMSDIDERKQAEDQLRRALAEKEVLLREVHHRVKNNLNIISSLLNIQSSLIQSPEQAVSAFLNSRDRIMAMALVHDDLYMSGDYARVDMDKYLKNLSRQLMQAYCSDTVIRVGAQAEGIFLSIGAAVPCGLILNELITNAIKHAFPKGGGEIRVLFRAVAEEFFELSVSDDGVGLPEGREKQESGSLGFTLIRLLSKQLDGSIEIISGNGTNCTIRFPQKAGT